MICIRLSGRNKCMKKACCVALLCITFVIMSFYFEKYYHPSYELNDFSDASEEEREAIALFYADDSSPISEGKYFDVKYANFSSAKIGNIRFEMIKKNTADVTFDSFILKDKSGAKEIEMTFYDSVAYDLDQGVFGVVLNLASDKYFQYYGYCNIASLTLEPDFDQLQLLGEGLTQDDIEQNFSQVTLSFKINGEEEVYELQYDEEKRFLYTKECKEKVLAGEKNRYYGVQASYYYSTLFYRDFKQWKVEIEQLLASGVDKEFDARIILNFPSLDQAKSREENMVCFRETLGLSNEEFAEYLTIVKKFIDLGYYAPDYIEEAAMAI